jgi:hypothetical protein
LSGGAAAADQWEDQEMKVTRMHPRATAKRAKPAIRLRRRAALARGVRFGTWFLDAIVLRRRAADQVGKSVCNAGLNDMCGNSFNRISRNRSH